MCPPPFHSPATAQVVRKSVRDYVDSFDRDRLEAQIKRSQGDAYVPPVDYVKERKEWNEAMSDLGVAARKGGSALLPKLQAMYTERVRSFKDAAGEFVAGYKDGYASEEAARREKEREKAEQAGGAGPAGAGPPGEEQSTGGPAPGGSPGGAPGGTTGGGLAGAGASEFPSPPSPPAAPAAKL